MAWTSSKALNISVGKVVVCVSASVRVKNLRNGVEGGLGLGNLASSRTSSLDLDGAEAKTALIPALSDLEILNLVERNVLLSDGKTATAARVSLSVDIESLLSQNNGPSICRTWVGKYRSDCYV